MPSLNLFPARVPIGRAIDGNGRSYDVMMTVEFSRALADLMMRVGGANGMDNAELAAIASTDATTAQLLVLQAEVEELRSMVEQAAPALALFGQVEAMRAELAMIEDPAAQVRYILTRFAALESPTFTGTPKAPTAAADTNTDQLATTKFVLGQAATSNPAAPGAAAPGASTRFARADHVHPSDGAKQNAISPATVTGSRAGNAALASLLAGLSGQGLINDSTTA